MSFEIGEKLEVVAIAARRGGSDKLVLEVGPVTLIIPVVAVARNVNVLFGRRTTLQRCRVFQGI